MVCDGPHRYPWDRILGPSEPAARVRPAGRAGNREAIKQEAVVL